MKTAERKVFRCAIYTRKSTEHNLDLAFNSLDAQREACEAYIKSQVHEGWCLIPDHYDDGGLSGASLDRPALQSLLADVRAGKINIVVVYKVDRLTRSLADFAKLVELFDQHAVSFASVTQSFNTTSSMGRLTLNVLLSFAQFEREVIGERVRDKIAASKRKGIWVGGPVPLLTCYQGVRSCHASTARMLRRLVSAFCRSVEPSGKSGSLFVIRASKSQSSNFDRRISSFRVSTRIVPPSLSTAPIAAFWRRPRAPEEAAASLATETKRRSASALAATSRRTVRNGRKQGRDWCGGMEECEAAKQQSGCAKGGACQSYKSRITGALEPSNSIGRSQSNCSASGESVARPHGTFGAGLDIGRDQSSKLDKECNAGAHSAVTFWMRVQPEFPLCGADHRQDARCCAMLERGCFKEVSCVRLGQLAKACA